MRLLLVVQLSNLIAFFQQNCYEYVTVFVAVVSKNKQTIQGRVQHTLFN